MHLPKKHTNKTNKKAETKTRTLWKINSTIEVWKMMFLFNYLGDFLGFHVNLPGWKPKENTKKLEIDGEKEELPLFFWGASGFLSFKQPTCSSQLLGIYVETETLCPDKWRSPSYRTKEDSWTSPEKSCLCSHSHKTVNLSPNFPSYPVEHLEMGKSCFNIRGMYWHVL